MISKRDLFKLGTGGAVTGLAGCAGLTAARTPEKLDQGNITDRLRVAAARPVLRADLIREPVILKSLDVLYRDGEYMIRAKDREGTVGWWLTNIRRFPAAVFRQPG